ncbi:MAG: hypothetical protein KDA69_21215 [Planctomycetaceae bacterium]|nr:hypothetical protein [Planctomycetaceae bacterium]MCB9951905.1 hypothetical protein [Planctomycetaceae bacterium]
MHRSPQQLTLREKLSEAEKLTRELMHHVEHGFIPKSHDLRRVTRQTSDPNAEEVSDLTVRNTAAKTLESDQYTRKLCEQLNSMLRYIQDDIERLQGRA